MEDSQIFRPTAQIFNCVLVGLIRRCKDSIDPVSRESCLEIINKKMIPTSFFDKKSLLLAVEALTAIPNTGEDPMVVVKNCMSLIQYMRPGFASSLFSFHI